MKTLFKKALVLFLSITFFLPSFAMPALAQTQSSSTDFDPAFIFTDTELQDTTSMSEADIQNFLELKNSYLAGLTAPDNDGIPRRASTIIYNAAVKYKINPRYIIATLQKEQDLIDGMPPGNIQDRLDWAAGYGVCDSCSKQDPSLQKFKGFGVQVDFAAGSNRFYFDNPGKFGLRVFQPAQIDGINFVPRTQATVNQYLYTPHIHGNQNLWQIWKEWFTRLYPNGTVLQAKGDKGIYLIKEGSRLPYATFASFLSSHTLDEVVSVDPAELQNYQLGPTIKFPNYSVLRAPDKSAYLLVNDALRPLASEEVVRQFGYNPDEIIDVALEDLRPYKSGKFITAADQYPTGAVVKNRDTNELYFIYEGSRKPIVSADVALLRFPTMPIIKVDSKTIKDIPLLSEAIYLKDSTLVKGHYSDFIYIISDGQRRLIKDRAAFDNLGFKWDNVKEVDDLTLSMHPEGEPINK